jgi:hypothetical protein
MFKLVGEDTGKPHSGRGAKSGMMEMSALGRS